MQEQTTKQTVDNLGESISVLVQAVNIAQSKGGVYTFADAAKINSALEFISKAGKQSPEGPNSSQSNTTKEEVAQEK
jgi:hypothetical protein